MRETQVESKVSFGVKDEVCCEKDVLLALGRQLTETLQGTRTS